MCEIKDLQRTVSRASGRTFDQDKAEAEPGERAGRASWTRGAVPRQLHQIPAVFRKSKLQCGFSQFNRIYIIPDATSERLIGCPAPEGVTSLEFCALPPFRVASAKHVVSITCFEARG